MRDYIFNACEEIDASMFSGDAFQDTEHREELKKYIGRWEREIERIEKHFEIDSACVIVIEKGMEYKVKSDCCYISYLDTDDYIRTLDQYNCETYCEDCIDEVVSKLSDKIKNKDDEIEIPEDFLKLDYQVESSPENQNFTICGNCGNIIRSGIIWSEQEIEHWTGLSDEKMKECIESELERYELMELFDPTDGAVHEYPEETKSIAEKVIRIHDMCD